MKLPRSCATAGWLLYVVLADAGPVNCKTSISPELESVYDEVWRSLAEGRRKTSVHVVPW